MSRVSSARSLVVMAALAGVLATGCCGGGMLVRPGVLNEPEQGNNACSGYFGSPAAGSSQAEQAAANGRAFRGCIQESGYLVVKEEMLLDTSVE